MGKYRMGRVNEEILKVLTDILRNVKDPRVSDNFVSFTEVQTSPDLRTAKVFFSHLSGEDKEIKEGLKSCAGFLRHSLAENLNLRMTPELTFAPDTSMAYAAHISNILNTLNIQPEQPENTEQPAEKTEEEK